MAFQDSTFRRSDATLMRLAAKYEVINGACTDISKRHVEDVFHRVFGYPLAVDPLLSTGRCLRKSNNNFTHDGTIINCPVTSVESWCVYEKVINNIADGGTIAIDLRTPIFRNEIPFVYVQHRDMHDRFSFGFLHVRIVETDEVFSPEEIACLTRLARVLGLDWGELDVLRDADDGRIYVVDANNTPSGPPRELDTATASIAVQRLSHTFERTFAARRSDKEKG